MKVQRTYNWSGLEKVIDTMCDEAYAAGLAEGIKVAAPVVVSKEDGIAIGYQLGFADAIESAAASAEFQLSAGVHGRIPSVIRNIKPKETP